MIVALKKGIICQKIGCFVTDGKKWGEVFGLMFPLIYLILELKIIMEVFCLLYCNINPLFVKHFFNLSMSIFFKDKSMSTTSLYLFLSILKIDLVFSNSLISFHIYFCLLTIIKIISYFLLSFIRIEYFYFQIITYIIICSF